LVFVIDSSPLSFNALAYDPEIFLPFHGLYIS